MLDSEPAGAAGVQRGQWRCPAAAAAGLVLGADRWARRMSLVVTPVAERADGVDGCQDQGALSGVAALADGVELVVELLLHDGPDI